MTDERFKQVEVATWVGIIGNMMLVILKGTTGIMSNSKALIADAAHSASEVAGSIAGLIGLRESQILPNVNPSRKRGKAESMAFLIVSVLLLFLGTELAISAIQSLWAGVHTPPKSYALIAIGISIVAKEVMFQYKYKLGNKLNSQALIMDAWKHRSDVYSSISVLLGVLGAILGQYFGFPYLYYLDPAAGLFIAFLILKMGYGLVMKDVDYRRNHYFQQEDTSELIHAVQRIKGVITVDELNAKEHGHYVFVDLKISVNPKISVLEGHDIAKMAKQLLMKQFTHIADVSVQVHPYDPGYPYKNNMDEEQHEVSTLLH